MATKYILMLFLMALYFTDCRSVAQATNKRGEKNYVFFLHNKFLENNASGTYEPQFKTRAEYNEIIASFKNDGFIVISEKRKPQTNIFDYAKKSVTQVDSLIAEGVEPNNITVIGTSKGGYIAQYVSTYAKNPALNFVFIGCYQDSDIEEFPGINFCGNILTIYEKSDIYGVSAAKRKELSNLPVGNFKEIEVNTGLRHGFLYVASDVWIKPCKMWARQNYDLK